MFESFLMLTCSYIFRVVSRYVHSICTLRGEKCNDIDTAPQHILADRKSINVFSFNVNFGTQGIRKNSMQMRTETASLCGEHIYTRMTIQQTVIRKIT